MKQVLGTKIIERVNLEKNIKQKEIDKEKTKTKGAIKIMYRHMHPTGIRI